MKDSIRRKLEKLDERFEEISRLLSDPGVISRQNQFRELSMEYARLGPLVARYRGYVALEGDIATAVELAMDEELGELSERVAAEELELQRLLVPKDPHDDSNVFLEVRAGTGGDEAAIFAGDLFRMYARYAESKGWAVEILSESPGEHGGHKEIISRIIGRGAFSLLKFESGTHRVQRV
ncbi:MAG: peptide chain release factor 1, partial [Gammaproteobacteria bacterium]|nr:peptide chain release factor 1 [Gammaproteobacteria bacterium]